MEGKTMTDQLEGTEPETETGAPVVQSDKLECEEYDKLINGAEAALQAATVRRVIARDAARRAHENLDKALADYRSTYPRKNAAQVHQERLAAEQALKQRVFDSGGDPRALFLVPEGTPPSPLDASAKYGRGGSVDGSHGDAFRRGHLAGQHQNKQLTPEQNVAAQKAIGLPTTPPG
jgi:hypothetical protein